MEKLFDTLEISNGWCCEFGAGNGINISNTYNLRVKGWKSVLIEGNANYNTDLMTLKNDNCFPIISFIDCEKNTLDSILSTTPIPREFDLMSMDVDGNDIYIWEGLKNYDPKVVILEYNSNFSSNDSLAIKYDARHVHKLDDYYGATAGALKN